MNRDLADMRQSYEVGTLEIEDALSDPIQQFEQWFAAAKTMEKEANAMTLATCSADGRPSARIVLLKGLDKRGFTFYTNYESRKGQQIAEHPYAALVFCWLSSERQVRIEGKVVKISAKESDAYYKMRPRDSQLGAWASPQSRVIDHRDVLESNLSRIKTEYEEETVIPRPGHWGGYRVEPEMIEFWQGRRSRLHDRIRYRRIKGEWKKERLAP